MTSSSALHAGRVVLTGLLFLVLWLLARCSPATTPAIQAAPASASLSVSPLHSPLATPAPAAPQDALLFDDSPDLLFLDTLDWLQLRGTEAIRQ